MLAHGSRLPVLSIAAAVPTRSVQLVSCGPSLLQLQRRATMNRQRLTELFSLVSRGCAPSLPEQLSTPTTALLATPRIASPSVDIRQVLQLGQVLYWSVYVAALVMPLHGIPVTVTVLHSRVGPMQ